MGKATNSLVSFCALRKPSLQLRIPRISRIFFLSIFIFFVYSFYFEFRIWFAIINFYIDWEKKSSVGNPVGKNPKFLLWSFLKRLLVSSKCIHIFDYSHGIFSPEICCNHIFNTCILAIFLMKKKKKKTTTVCIFKIFALGKILQMYLL